MTTTEIANNTTYRILEAPIPLILPNGYTLSDAFHVAAKRIWATAETKVRNLVTRHPGRFPLYTDKGQWAIDAEAWTNWCEGFLGGQLWLLAQRTGDSWFRRQAEEYSTHLEDRKDDRDVHDLNFLFWPTWRRWYEATGDTSKNDVVVHAGRTLAMRFNAVVETNSGAVHLWQSLGFQILATIPEAFDHPRNGLVGLHVMYRRL